MKLMCLFVICVLGMAAIVTAQKTANSKLFQLPPLAAKTILPTLTGFGGGSSKQGFDVSLNAQQKFWESQNKRHSIDGSVGYSQYLGGPYGKSRPDYRVGAGYTFKFG